MQDCILAIDIGGSKYMTGIVDVEGNVLYSERRLWNELTNEGVLKSIVSSASKMLSDHSELSPCAIGATIPGLADPKRGVWVEACFSGVGNISIGDALRERFAMPAYIDNDGQACALAERLFGACRGIEDFVYLTVSNGCGGAVFANDSIYYGSTGNAGELGHITVEPNGRQCNCGARGCLEMHAAGPAIAKNFIELGGPSDIGGKAPDASTIAALARSGDLVAIKTFELEGMYIGRAIAAACNLLNPGKVIIGGGVSLAFDLFEKPMWESINSSMYKNANRLLSVEPTALGYNGGLLGAAAVAVCGMKQLHGWGNVK